MARGTLYLYFRNKDDIYLAVATRGAYVLNQMLWDSSSSTATGFEKVKRYLSAFNQFYQDYPGYYLALWSSNMPRYDETDLSAMEEMIRIRSDNFRIIKEAIAEGIQDESIRNDIDPELVTLFWMAAYQSVISVSPAVAMHMHVHNVGHTKLIEYAIEIVLRSLERQ